MPETDPTLGEKLNAAHNWARAKAEPYLSWLPDSVEPYAVDIVAGLVLFAALVALWRNGLDLLRTATAPLWALWRWAAGTEAPKSETAVATEAAQRAEEASKRSEEANVRLERKIDEALRTGRIGVAEDGRPDTSEYAIDRAISAAREVLHSNDPAKAKAQEALQIPDFQAAEDALEEAFNREVQAYARVDDQTQQLKAKAARTAREKAALAATRSVVDALAWYRKAAELAPEHFWTHIELARLHALCGDLGAALDAAETGYRVATDDRDCSVASNEIGDVQVAQGDLAAALKSFGAGLEIRERLAAQDPGHAGWQRDLSVSHDRIGDVQVAQGDLAAALKSFGAGLEIAERLAAQDPGHAGWQADLAASHGKLGQLLKAMGQREQALEMFEKGRAIVGPLAENSEMALWKGYLRSFDAEIANLRD